MAQIKAAREALDTEMQKIGEAMRQPLPGAQDGPQPSGEQSQGGAKSMRGRAKYQQSGAQPKKEENNIEEAEVEIIDDEEKK